MLIATYAALAVLGCAYVLVSAFLGHGTDGGADAEATSVHSGDAGSHYGVDGSGHGDTSAAGSSGAEFHFPFFSPLALSTVFGSLGAYGLISKLGLEVRDGTSLVIAVPASLATAYAVTYASYRLVSTSTGSSTIRSQDLVGSSGEVTTPIPEGGAGEVAASVRGERFSSAAREESGAALPRGTHVVVSRVVGATLIVKRA